MFETLENRQFLSTTLITDGTSNTLELAPTATQADSSARPVMHVRKAGGDQQDYYVVKMTDAMVSSYN
jgi:type VI protein secretion system component Hcp